MVAESKEELRETLKNVLHYEVDACTTTDNLAVVAESKEELRETLKNVLHYEVDACTTTDNLAVVAESKEELRETLKNGIPFSEGLHTIPIPIGVNVGT